MTKQDRWQNLRAKLFDYMNSNGVKLNEVSNSFYGNVKVYQVNSDLQARSEE